MKGIGNCMCLFSRSTASDIITWYYCKWSAQPHVLCSCISDLGGFDDLCQAGFSSHHDQVHLGFHSVTVIGVQKKAQRAADAAAKAARCWASHLCEVQVLILHLSLHLSSLHWNCHTSSIPTSCCLVYLWPPCRRHLHWLRFAAMLDVQARSFDRGFVKWPLLLARNGLGSSSHRGWSIQQEEWKHSLVRDLQRSEGLSNAGAPRRRFRGSRFHSHGIRFLDDNQKIQPCRRTPS